MKSKTLVLSIVCALMASTALGQSGPGGIGDGTGTNGPRNTLWLDANTLGLVNDDPVTTWADQSGNGNDLIQQSTDPVPVFRNDGLGGAFNVVRFDGSERYLTLADNATLDGTPGVSIIMVMRSALLDGQPRGLLSKRVNSSTAESYSIFTHTSNRLNFDVRTSGDSRINSSGTTLNTTTNYILSNTYDGGTQSIFIQSALTNSTGLSGTVNDASAPLYLGTLNNNYGTYYDGDIAEVIIYGDGLNNAERIVIENYLSTKYGISIGVNDFWSDNATYSNQLAGIGQESTAGTEAVTAASGFLRISESTDLSNGDWLFWGHDNADATTYTTTEIPTGSAFNRLAREWFVEETGSTGTVTVSFDESEIPATGFALPTLYLLVDTDGNFTDATSVELIKTGSTYSASLDIANNSYLTLAFDTPLPAGLSTALAFWYQSSAGVQNGGLPATNAQNVTQWNDLSANTNNAQNGTAPVYLDNNPVNFYPVVQFDAAASEFLEFDLSGLENTNYTVMAVVQRQASTSQSILGSANNAADAFNMGYSTNTQVDGRNSNTATTSASVVAFNSPEVTPSIVALNFDGANLTVSEFRDGASASGGVATGVNYNPGISYTGNLGRALAGNHFDGEVMEIVGFSNNLSSTEQNALVSHLAIKYGISLFGTYVDELNNPLWTAGDNAGFAEDVTAIGADMSFELDQRVSKSKTDSVVLATTADFSSLNNASGRSSLSDGQYVFVSNNDGAYTLSASFGSATNNRLDRVWRVRELGSPGAIIFGIPETLVSANIAIVSSDPTFATGVTQVSLANSGGYIFLTHDFADGDYITFINDDPDIWYSYLSGNWSDPGNWTLDGAISALFINPDGKTPTIGDSVVIRSGRTITADIDNIQVERLELTGTLDLVNTSGHDFTLIEGSGVLRAAGSATGVDNYPAGEDSLFYDPQEGGTVEYYGTGLNLDQIRRYNNLIINLTNAADRAEISADSIYVFGSLQLTRGIAQFNDNLNTDPVVVTVSGDVSVAASGGIEVSTVNARHEFNLHGDFTNQGVVNFTNRSSAITGSEATDGIVDVNFVSATQDQIVLLQNTTDFYRIEINKGVDDTYMVDLSATDPSFFNLYGFAGLATNSAQLTTNANALGLIFGTVKIGNNIDIAQLNASGANNYSIFEGAQIWVAGGTVSKTTGVAIVPYGRLRITSGSINAPINSGITTRDNGQVTIEGGIVTVNQFRTSINGVTAQGGLVMSGGVFNIIGGSTSTNYYTFSLTYEGNVFSMSGGTINLSGSNTTGGIYINSSDENIVVTGGTINLDVTNNNDLTVTSRAPFYDLNVLRSSAGASGRVLLSGGSSGTGGGQTTLNLTSFSVLNDLTIDNSGGNGTEFLTNGVDLDLTGSLNIQNGAVVDLTGMELTFNREGTSFINIMTGATLAIDSLTVNKTNPNNHVDITNGAADAIVVNNLLNIASGNLEQGAFNVVLNGDLTIADTIGTNTSSGVLRMSGAAAQTINSSAGLIYDLELNNANGVSLNGDLIVWDQLALNAGIFDIGTDELTITSPISTSGTFGTTLMIQTSGNTSDDGLTVYFDGTNANPFAFVYPIGTSANSNVRYTPVSVNLSDILDDGYVQVNISDTELQTVDISALSNNLLTYYWRVRHREFGTLPTVESLIFPADDSDDPDGGATPTGLPANFVPGKVLNESPFTRSQEDVADISGLTITFDGSGAGFPIENANYTAGDGTTTLFDGTPTVYYTTTVGRRNWNDETKWSLTDDGVDDGNTGFPQVGDIAVIKSYGNSNQNHWVNVNIDVTIAELQFDRALGGWLPRAWVTRRTALLDLGPVSGEGAFFLQVTAAESPTFVGNTDLGEFSGNANSVFNFRIDADNQTVDMPNNILVYPNLRIEASNGADDDDNRILQTSVPITINGYVRMDRSPRWRINHDVSIGDDLRITWQENRTTVELGDDREVTLDVAGDLRLENGAGNDASRLLVKNDNQQGFEHTLRVGGDIIIEANLEGTSAFDLYNGTGLNNNAILELYGAGNFSFTNSSSATLTPDLYRVVMNAGSDTSSVFTFNDNFVLNGDNTAAPQAFELQNGKAVINDAAINFELTNGAQYIIPPTAGLEVTQGTVTSTGATLILNGLLRVNGGSVSLGTSAIEYSNTGAALLEVTSGTLDIGYQLRRATTSNTGILKYRQRGGTVNIGVDGAPVADRGVFEVLNGGSELTLTGGTFNLVRGVTGDNNPSLLLDPQTTDLTGSTINVFTGLGATYGANFFNIQSTVALNNLTIDNSIDLPDARVFVQPLTVNDLTINTNQVLLADGLDLSLTGNLTNTGTYTNTSSNTRFISSAAQSVTGGGTFTIFNLVQEGSGTTSLGVDLNLDNDLFVTAGVLDLGANAVSLRNDAFIESSVINSGGNGIVFNGTAGQDLYGLSNNTVTVPTITIANSNGVDIPDGNGYNFDITRELRLAGGVLNIGNSLVSIKSGGTITPVTPFNVNNMVQTNSSFTDNGLLVEWPTNVADTTLFFPIGELSYTPVQFDLLAGATSGSIRIRPANEIHPSIINDVEPGGEAQIDDTQNILAYFWIVESLGTTNVQGTATFFYNHQNIIATTTDTSNFISGRLLSNGITWDKFDPTLFNGASQTFTVPLDQGSGVTFAEITGDYTAGYGSTDGANNDIEGSIPNTLAIYESNFTGLGNYSTDGNWTPVGSPALSSGIGPVGAVVRVTAGDTVDLDISNIRLYSTEVQAGGVLRVPAGSINNRLGNVTGTGTIILTDTELLPTGEYSAFFDCNGGALQFSGTSSYSVLSGISQIRKVIFEGSGTRTLPNNVLTVCDTMIVDGPTVALSSGLNYSIGDTDEDRLEIVNGTVTLSNGSTIDLNGDMLMSGGSFTGASGTSMTISDDINYSGGTLNWNSTAVTLDGTTSQQIDGVLSGSAAFRNLTINNSSTDGIRLTSGGIEVSGLLTFTDGFVNSRAGGTIALTSSGSWTGASNASCVIGPLTKQNVLLSSSFEFPIGKVERYAPAWVVNVGTGGQDWTGEYFTSVGAFDDATFDSSDPGSGLNPLSDVSSRDRWEITSSGSNSAEIRIYYGTHLSLADQNDLRVVWWDPADSRWENRGGIIDGTITEGTVTSENAVSFSTQQFSIGQAPETPLPVEFIFFSAMLNGSQVDLEWATASEIDNDFFEVQRSADGLNYEVIGTVTGNGNSTEVIDYAYTDRRPLIGTVYYRLRQVDYDGNFAFSNVVLIDNTNPAIAFAASLYPNPVLEGEFSLQLASGDEVSPISVRIFDTNGRFYHNAVYTPGDFFNDLKVVPQQEMPAGIYIVTVQQNDQRQNIRLIVR